MLRPNPRFLIRSKNYFNPTLLRAPRSFVQNRLISSTPPQKSRSWKSLFVRVGLAAGVVYFYNTSTVFAEEPAYAIPNLRSSSEDDESALPILNNLTTPHPATAPVPTLASQPHLSSDETSTASSIPPSTTRPWDSPSSSTISPPLEKTEEEASQQGAFNEETGEINWDCPCLGGMAHGTCGEHFRAAFSCFVYSKEDPKGMDCIEHFKTMQSCFREHPDEYGAELEDVEEDDEIQEGEIAHADVGKEEASATANTRQNGDQDEILRYPSREPLPESAKKGLQAAENRSDDGPATPPSSSSSTTSATTPAGSAFLASSPSPASPNSTQLAKATEAQVATQNRDPVSRDEQLVPKAAHDARETAQDGKV